MKIWKGAALTAALVAAAGVGAAVTPVADGQTPARERPTARVFSVGSGSHIGVSVRDVEAGDKAAHGVVVEEVTSDSPAAKAGLRAGDVVVEFDGERVRSVRQFTRLVQETVPGRRVPVAVERDGQRSSLTVEPAEPENALRALRDRDWQAFDTYRGRVAPPPVTVRPSPAPRAWAELEAFMTRGGTAIGVTLDELEPQLAEYFGTKDGVLVRAVRENSAAAKAGLKAGDVITAVNERTVTSAADVRRELQRLSSDEFTLSVVRDRKAMTIKGKVEETRRDRRTFRSTI